MQPDRCPTCGGPVTTGCACARCRLQATLAGHDERLSLVPENWEIPDQIRFIGDYLVLDSLGSGAMGEVFRGRDVRTHRYAAIKVLKTGAPDERFQREIRALGSLDHPGIVKVLCQGTIDGRPWFAMDYIDGTSLAALAHGRPLAPRQAAAFLADIAEALAYAHARGVLHRDLKPSNILVNSFQKALLADFGLAKLLHGDRELTRSDQPLGTPSYMAPEQVEQRLGADSARTDIYGLGATLYHLLTGVPPFRAESLPRLMRMIAEQEPASPRVLNGSVDRDLETLCLKCLRKSPADRYASALELAEELRRWLDGRPIRARPLSRTARVARWARRQPALAGAVGASLLFLLLGIAGVGWQWRTAEQRRAEAVTNSHQKSLERAEDLLDAGRGREAIQLLHDTLRVDPSDRLVARRLYAALVQQPLPRRLTALAQPTDATWAEAWFAPTTNRLILKDSKDRLWLAPTHRGSNVVALAGGSPIRATPLFSPEGDWLVFLTADRRLLAIDLSTGVVLSEIAFDEDPRQLALSPDGRSGVVIHSTGVTWFREGPRFRAGPRIEIQGPIVAAIAKPGDLVVVGTTNALHRIDAGGQIRRLDLPLLGEPLEVREAPGFGQMAALDQAGLHLFHPAEDRLDETLPAASRAPMALDYSADGTRWMLAGRANAWHLLNPRDPEIVRSIPAHAGPISAVQVHPTRLWLTTGSDDGTIRVWHLRDGSPASDVIDLGAPVRDAALSADGLTLCALTIDGRGELWAIPRRPAALHPIPLPVPAYGLFATPDGRNLVQPDLPEPDAEETRQLFGYDLDRGQPWRQTLPQSCRPQVDFAELGNQAGMTTIHGDYWVFSATNATDGFQIPGPFGEPVFSPHGDLVAGRVPAGVSIWSTLRRQPERLLALEEAPAWMAFPRNASALALWDSRGPRLMDLRGSTTRILEPDQADLPDVVRVSPSGAWLAWARSPSWYLVDTRTGRRIASPFVGQVSALAFDPGERHLAVGTREGTIRVLDLGSLQPVGMPMRHSKAVNSIAYSSDGSLLATAAADHTVRLWDSTTGLALSRAMNSSGVYDVRFSTDDRFLLSATGMRWEFPRLAAPALASRDLLRAAQMELGITQDSPEDTESRRPYLAWLAGARTAADSDTLAPGGRLTWKDYRERRWIAGSQETTASPSPGAVSSASYLEIAESDPQNRVALAVLQGLREARPVAVPSIQP